MDSCSQIRKAVGRFAPSPTGRMHLGNVYCAVLSYVSVKCRGGEWLLRIEDLDRGRSRGEWTERILDDLAWLGLESDREPLVQSRRDAVYETYYRRLEEAGLIYPCFCSRADLLSASAPHASDGRVVYAGTCRNLSEADRARLSAARRPAMRLKVEDRTVAFDDRICGHREYNLARDCGDFVVRRADGGFAYQLAVVVDDALSGVTEVLRGEDLLLSAAQQSYLYELLGFPVPEFCHVPLILGESGQRLCKRDESFHMGNLRRECSRERILGLVARHAGLQPDDTPLSLGALEDLWALRRKVFK